MTMLKIDKLVNTLLYDDRFPRSHPGNRTPPLALPGIYTYVVARNGLFVYARRSGLEAMIPVVLFPTLLGDMKLNVASAFCTWSAGKLDDKFFSRVISHMRRHLPNESVLQVALRNNQWSLVAPNQTQQPGSVRFSHHDFPSSIMDIHSHPVGSGPAYFSLVDNAETNDFRIYLVISQLEQRYPSIAGRLSIYRHSAPIDLARFLPEVTVFSNIGKRHV